VLSFDLKGGNARFPLRTMGVAGGAKGAMAPTKILEN